MNAFIDVFYSHTEPTIPQAVVWRDGKVVLRVAHHHLSQTVALCRKLSLPVVTNDQALRVALLSRGIRVQPFLTRSVGEKL